MKKKISHAIYRFIKWLVWLFYPKMKVEGLENLPQEPSLVVANHSQLHGPVACELYFPGNRYTWCAGQMMHLKDVPAYAYEDFWSGKPKWQRPFWKLLSYLIAPLSVCIFTNANTIGVYRDSRIISTFKNTVKTLQSGAHVVVFPECYTPYSNICNGFQENFVEIAKLYYKRTGKALRFVPMYIAPNLKTMYLEKPVTFDPDAPIAEEKKRICQYLMETITQKGRSLPLHTVVPYPNIPKRDYPKNKCEDMSHETTGC